MKSTVKKRWDVCCVKSRGKRGQWTFGGCRDSGINVNANTVFQADDQQYSDGERRAEGVEWVMEERDESVGMEESGGELGKIWGRELKIERWARVMGWNPSYSLHFCLVFSPRLSTWQNKKAETWVDCHSSLILSFSDSSLNPHIC